MASAASISLHSLEVISPPPAVTKPPSSTNYNTQTTHDQDPEAQSPHGSMKRHPSIHSTAQEELGKPRNSVTAEDVTEETPEGGRNVFQASPPVSEMKVKMLAAHVAVGLAGINDAVPGALIPTLQQHYGIGTGIVALT